METEAIQLVAVTDLTFDFKNPRLPEFGLTDSSTEEEVIRVLWEAMDVRELVMSIAASGFFRHEPLIVAEEDGKNVVIEGNRRLAAVRVLLDPAVAEGLRTEAPSITVAARRALLELPVVLGTREDSWRHLGFKHVNGPAMWSSYAKARYIAEVRRNFGVRLEDIAKQIGDTHRTVQRLFRGLMVIEQAERMKVFSRDDRWRSHFSFSHLYTGLNYSGISEFIGLEPETAEESDPVPLEREEELGELFLWMYGSKSQQRPPIIETQNPHLRQLESVVSNREALAALRAGDDLSIAFEVSRPSSTVFEEALLASKRDLQKAREMLSTGYDGSKALLAIAGDVAELAEDLYEEMRRKRNRGRSRRTAEAD
ncbi:MAG: ParB N-terminal domain-containing protein [Spirochaetaceae bacterium]|nr:ParB N-terminal domain-containing protein [Spirochaetaceae bacterium]